MRRNRRRGPLALTVLGLGCVALGACADAPGQLVERILRFGRGGAPTSDYGPAPAVPIAPPATLSVGSVLHAGAAPAVANAALGGGGLGASSETPGGGANPSTDDATQGPAPAPAPVRTEAELWAELQGVWQYQETGERDGGRFTSTCVLRVTRHEGHERCTTLVVRDETAAAFPCNGARSYERTTESPYAIELVDGQVRFAPGEGRVVTDTSCEPSQQASHTEMRGEVHAERLDLAEYSSSTHQALGPAVYTRLSR